MSEATFTELLDIAERMAQELTELADAADEAGSPLTSTRELLEEFESLWRRTDRYWQGQVKGDGAPGIEAL